VKANIHSVHFYNINPANDVVKKGLKSPEKQMKDADLYALEEEEENKREIKDTNVEENLKKLQKELGYANSSTILHVVECVMCASIS
jgi:hypothetical protein